YYNDMTELLKPYAGENLLLNYYYTLAEVLSIKAPLGIKIHEAYHQKDRDTLKLILEQDIPSCMLLLQTLKDYRELLWFEENKPFGFEVVDIRFGGVITRLESTRKRIKQYLDGKISILEELEEPRVLFDPDAPQHLPACNFWEKIVTAGNASSNMSTVKKAYVK
ncbi:MAG: hypothetical protein K0R00_4010, partial [Herbinix sp.]|nr:hypothetical protein [Herbinix sp.]